MELFPSRKANTSEQHISPFLLSPYVRIYYYYYYYIITLLLLLLHQNRCKQESVREQRMIEKKEYIMQWPRLFPIATEGLRAPDLATGQLLRRKQIQKKETRE